MFALPKLILIILVVIVAWYALRWLNRPPGKVARRRPSAAPRSRPALEAEDLVLCGLCSSYVAAGAPGCARAGCPRPR